jgi:hypothetical protein
LYYRIVGSDALISFFKNAKLLLLYCLVGGWVNCENIIDTISFYRGEKTPALTVLKALALQIIFRLL